MKLDLVGVGIAHFRDLLPLGNILTLFHHQLAVMGIDAQERIVVLDDDELAEAADTGAAEDDPAWRAGKYRLAGPACDAYAFAAILEAGHELAIDGPHELGLLAIR